MPDPTWVIEAWEGVWADCAVIWSAGIMREMYLDRNDEDAYQYSTRCAVMTLHYELMAAHERRLIDDRGTVE